MTGRFWHPVSSLDDGKVVGIHPAGCGALMTSRASLTSSGVEMDVRKLKEWIDAKMEERDPWFSVEGFLKSVRVN